MRSSAFANRCDSDECKKTNDFFENWFLKSLFKSFFAFLSRPMIDAHDRYQTSLSIAGEFRSGNLIRKVHLSFLHRAR